MDQKIYENGYVYKLTFEVDSTNYEYIGSTIQLQKRVKFHMDQPRNQMRYMFDHFNEAKFDVIFNYKNITRKELYDYENDFIKKISPLLNYIGSKCCVPCYVCKDRILYDDINKHLSIKHNILPKIKLLSKVSNTIIDLHPTTQPNDVTQFNDFNNSPPNIKLIFEQCIKLADFIFPINLLYDSIKNIDLEKAYQIAMNLHFANNMVSNMDKSCINKFIFKYLLKNNIKEEEYRTLYDCYFISVQQRQIFWNLFTEFLIEFKYLDNKSCEIIKERINKYSYIKKICNLLGLSNSQDVNTYVTEDNWKKNTLNIINLQNDIKLIFRSRDQAKANSDCHDKSKILDLINPIMRKWGLTMLVKKRVQIKQLDGKRVDLPSKYYLKYLTDTYNPYLMKSFNDKLDINSIIDLK